MRPNKPKPGCSLAEKRPDLAKEWSEENELTPFDIGLGSHYIASWVCSACGWEWPANVYSRSNHRNLQGCPNCKNNRLSKLRSKPLSGKSLWEINKSVAMTFSLNNPCTPYDIYANSHKEYNWICTKCGGEYRRVSYSRMHSSSQCSNCSQEDADSSQRVPIRYEESLEYKFPEIASTWSSDNITTPDKIYPNTTGEHIWVCTECHKEYRRSGQGRRKSSICKPCIDRLSALKNSHPLPFLSFADLYPDLLKEYSRENDRNPYSLKPHSGYIAKWVCKECHTTWRAYIYNRSKEDGTGCPTCNSSSQTSNAEQLLRKALLIYGASPLESYKINKWSVDIYFPESRTIIEYDGAYYHSFPKSLQTDTRKSLDLLSQGYTLIRVRTYSKNYQLPSLQISHSSYHEISIPEPLDSQPTPDLLDKLTSLL